MTINTIAILGGGIGGLASAILLSRKGLKVTVFDKAPSPRPVGAGFLLQPPGQMVLQNLGVLETVKQQSVPIFALQSKTTDGRSILYLEYNKLSGNPRTGLGVQRSTIYAALLSAAQQCDHIQFVWNSEVVKCVTFDSSVEVTVGGERLTFDLGILSSGANSNLVDQQLGSRIKQPYGWGCLWTTIELPTSLSPHVLHQRCRGSNKMMGILPVRKSHDDYEAALYWSMKSEDINQLDSSSFQRVKTEIMDFWPEAASSLVPLSYQNFVKANYHDIWTSKPFNRRLIALGDASHATSPQLGQGCTMALLDAWNLALHMPAVDDELEESMKSWWHSRRYQLAYVRYLSRFMTPLFQSESKLCEVFRDRIMAPFGRTPWFESLQLKTLCSEVFLDMSES